MKQGADGSHLLRMCNARCTLPVTPVGARWDRVQGPQTLLGVHPPVVAQPMLYHHEGCPSIGPL